MLGAKWHQVGDGSLEEAFARCFGCIYQYNKNMHSLNLVISHPEESLYMCTAQTNLLLIAVLFFVVIAKKKRTLSKSRRMNYIAWQLKSTNSNIY